MSKSTGAACIAGLLRGEQIVMLSGGSLAGDARPAPGPSEGDWEIQGDPTEAAFLVAERKLGVTDGVSGVSSGSARSHSPRSAR